MTMQKKHTKTCLNNFPPFSQQTLTMLQRQKYQFRVLGAFVILYLKLYNY